MYQLLWAELPMPQNSYVGVLITTPPPLLQNVTMLGDGVLKEVK